MTIQNKIYMVKMQNVLLTVPLKYRIISIGVIPYRTVSHLTVSIPTCDLVFFCIKSYWKGFSNKRYDIVICC